MRGAPAVVAAAKQELLRGYWKIGSRSGPGPDERISQLAISGDLTTASDGSRPRPAALPRGRSVAYRGVSHPRLDTRFALRPRCLDRDRSRRSGPLSPRAGASSALIAAVVCRVLVNALGL